MTRPLFYKYVEHTAIGRRIACRATFSSLATVSAAAAAAAVSAAGCGAVGRHSTDPTVATTYQMPSLAGDVAPYYGDVIRTDDQRVVRPRQLGTSGHCACAAI